MKKFLALFFILFLQVNAEEDLRCSQLSGNIYQLEWNGVPGRSYFIEASTDNMLTWNYLPDIRLGQGQILRLGFEKIIDGMFLRLRYTDFPTNNPDIADFDGDGRTNLEELVVYGTSPFQYDISGSNPSGGSQPSGGDPDVPLAQFELQVIEKENGILYDPTRIRLDAGFNAITNGGFYVDGGVPSISVSRSSDVVTEIKLIDLTGNNQGATLNYLQLQKDKHPTDPAQPDITSMVNGWALTLPLAQGEVIPIPSVSITLTGDLPPAEAGSTTDWLLKPMDITAVFGIGADGGSREYFTQKLEDMLAAESPDPLPDEIFNAGNIWGVLGVAPRPEANPNQIVPKIYAIEIVDSADPMGRSLQSKQRTVIFDGHSNFGMGPNFVKTPLKTISDFTNYGVGYTNILTEFYGIEGEMADLVPSGDYFDFDDPATGLPDFKSEGAAANGRTGAEGWGYLILEPGPNPGDISPQLRGDVINYIPLENLNPAPNVGLRFPGSGVGNQGTLSRQGIDPNFFHYVGNIIVDAPESDLPPAMGYKSFFYNACDTGRDYIENFQHGSFLYTTQTCEVDHATWIFVEQALDGREVNFIKHLMNDTDGLGGQNDNIDYYESYIFPN